RELCWLAVDRGMAAALDADDPLAVAQAVWYAAHLLRSVGRAEEALERLREARALIEPRVADGPAEYAAMLADLYVCMALTRARSSDQGAWSDWATARDVVHRALPAAYVGLRTRVSRPLVEVYGVMRSEEHTSELQSRENLVCRLLLEKKKHRTPRAGPCRRALG